MHSLLAISESITITRPHITDAGGGLKGISFDISLPAHPTNAL